eukprot:TRINITY_DN676_c0_g1_i6.p1 TRINITY_DN676_c0_g1~~TRINITY_DN676_c0_g1_i6.p1  ORF type:complete len:116 (-),score=7.27 TRINITY_DN676_c0_g1_i6:1212-1559(-)
MVIGFNVCARCLCVRLHTQPWFRVLFKEHLGSGVRTSVHSKGKYPLNRTAQQRLEPEAPGSLTIKSPVLCQLSYCNLYTRITTNSNLKLLQKLNLCKAAGPDNTPPASWLPQPRR